MAKIIGTSSGRIFLGGQDGSLNEVTYQAEEGWFTPKCRKLNYTANRIMKFFPSFLQRNSQSTPIVDLVVDDTRNIMYSLHTDGSIQVVDLGLHGDAFRVVIHKTNIASEAVRFVPQMFPDSAGASARKELTIVGIYPIQTTESSTLHLVAVTRTGVRLYFGTSSNTHYHSRATAYDRSKRPESLILYHVRFPPSKSSGPAPPFSGSPSRAGASEASTSSPEDVVSACYSSGVLLLADNRGVSGDALIAVGSDTATIFRDAAGGAAATVSYAMGPQRRFDEFREISFAVKMADGKAHALAEIPLTKLAPKSLVLLANDPTLLRNELALQTHLLPQREFLCLSSSRLLLVQRTWPVDHLRHLLRVSAGSDNALLREFRKTYGLEETCAMCLIIVLNDAANDRQIADLATAMFYHAGGHPRVEFPSSFVQPNAGSSSQPMTEADILSTGGTILLSGGHDGISLYLTRLLRPIWHQAMFIAGSGSPFYNKNNMAREQLEQLQRQLLSLKAFIETMVSFQAPQSAAGVAGTPARLNSIRREAVDVAREKERQSLQSIHALIKRCSEVLSLLDIVSLCDSNRVMNLVSSGNKAKVVQMRFGASISQNEEYLYSDLIDAVFRTVSSSDDADKRDRISEALRTRCPTLFKEEDKIRMKAQEFTQRAMLVGDGDFAEQWHLLEDSLERYVTIAAYLVERLLLADVVQLYVYFRFYRGAVELVLRCALASDTDKLGIKFYKTRDPANEKGKAAFEKRYSIYSNLNAFFDEMRHGREPTNGFQTLLDAGTLPARPVVTPEQLQTLLDDGLKFARERDDELFHYWMYEFDYSAHATSELVELDTPYIEWWLKNRMENRAVSLDLLSRYYQSQKRDGEAARCLLELAGLPDADLPSDVRITLEDRLSSLAEAQLLSVSSRDQQLVREIAERLELARIQRNILRTIEGEYDSNEPQTRKAILDLNSQLFGSSDLWKQFAARFGLREQALDILKASGMRNADLVKRLWKNIFDDFNPNGEGYNLDALKTKVRDLTFRYYPATDTVFPLDFIVVELEMISLSKIYSMPMENNLRLQDPRNGANVKWVFEALVSDPSKPSGVPIPSLVTVYSDIIERGGAFSVPPDSKLHFVRVLGALLKYAFELNRSGALPETQLRQLRSNRVRSTVERLLAELPKYGAEGSNLKEDLYRNVEENLH